MPVVFWTDALIYILVTAVIAGIFVSIRTPHLFRPWQKVTRSRTAMVSLVILITYASLGLLDSIHYFPQLEPHQETDKPIYANEAISLMDAWLAPLWQHSEKTYSAPFATYSYAREMATDTNGTVRWEYPRLEYGGAHLSNPEKDKSYDIMSICLRGLLFGLCIYGILIELLTLLMSRIQQRPPRDCLKQLFSKSKRGVPWLWMSMTLSIILVGGSVIGELALKYHVLGTDKVGQDVLYQALKSIRTGLAIGTLTTLVMLPFALLLGIMAGYFRGWVDDVIQYIYTTLNSIPGVLLIAAAILMMQVYMANNEDAFDSLAVRADLRLLFLCLILGVTSWTGLCRLLRAETLKLREMDYVQAATALGVTKSMIMWRHILPNVMHIVLITIVLDFCGLVLAEAVLSYVNIGVDPTTNSWGNMINVARLELAREPIVWWSLTAAFLFMFTLVIAANLFADAVRDAFDPRKAD